MEEQVDKRGGAAVFSGSGRPMGKESAAQEIGRLRKELAQVKQENEILKKAAAFFARELK